MGKTQSSYAAVEDGDVQRSMIWDRSALSSDTTTDHVQAKTDSQSGADGSQHIRKERAGRLGT